VEESPDQDGSGEGEGERCQVDRGEPADVEVVQGVDGQGHHSGSDQHHRHAAVAPGEAPDPGDEQRGR
jgi:hypothetical protein